MHELSVSRKLLVCSLFCILAAGQTEEVKVSGRSYIPGLPPNDPGLVQVSVVVRDSQGHAVAGLRPESFQVLDQGKASPVAGMIPVDRSPNAKLPQHIVLCFDDYGSTPGSLQRAKLLASRFIQDGIGPADQVAVASTYHKQMLGFTTDKSKIQGAIDRLQQQATPSMSAPQISRPGQMPGSGRGPAGLMTGSDQSFAQEIVAQSMLGLINTFTVELAKQPGNRVMVLFSPGYIGTPEREQDHAIAQAIAASVVVNVVDSKSSLTESPSASAEPVYRLPPATYTTEPGTLGIEAGMADLAHSTGGLLFHHNGDPFSRGFRELGAVPEVMYVLAVPPERGDQKYHHLKVSAASDASIAFEARSGYFPVAKSSAEGGDPAQLQAMRSKLDQQVAAMKTVADFPSSVAVQYNKLANGNTAIRVTIHVDIKALPFGVLDGRHTQRLTLVAAAIDSNGKLVSAKEGIMDLALSDAKYNSMLESGTNLTLNLEAPPGVYRLSTVAQDALQGKMASTLNAIQVP